LWGGTLERGARPQVPSALASDGGIACVAVPAAAAAAARRPAFEGCSKVRGGPDPV
jgi:hypothetical protein